MNAKKIHKTMVLQREELEQDIRNNAYKVSLVVEAADDIKGEVRDIAELNNRETMYRAIFLAVGRLVTFMQPFSAYYKDIHTLVTDKYREDNGYHIHLEVSEKFPENVFWHLKDLCHEFVVTYAIYDHLRSLALREAAIWKEKLDELEDEIKKIANKQYGIVYRPFTPL